MTGETPATSAPLRADALTKFRGALVSWFRRHGRDYPWRRTRDAYAILVSEVMLQQTQIATVLDRGYYARWMERFPDVETLAAASETEVLQTWEGLGYYSRARNLQRAAAAVVREHGGVFPGKEKAIAALPGVGRYTAGAVLSFAFNKSAPIVDGNVARVLARLFRLEEEIDAPAGQRLLWTWAASLTDPRHPRLYNSAVMELGQRLCTPRRPACGECPVREWCQSAGPDADSLPRKRPARATVLMDEHVLWAQRDGHLLLIQETGRRRKGLWRLPERNAEEVRHLPLLSRTQYSITHHRVTLSVYDASTTAAAANEQWQPAETLSALPMPGPFRKVVDALLGDFGF
ncbi:MAG TPA: A/G-specific adenine glycosylase [Verrucomicrobiales bacterium]|nr:A/G-specific adenine glycosylase [Verrucomicrobiales bacterium]